MTRTNANSTIACNRVKFVHKRVLVSDQVTRGWGSSLSKVGTSDAQHFSTRYLEPSERKIKIDNDAMFELLLRHRGCVLSLILRTSRNAGEEYHAVPHSGL